MWDMGIALRPSTGERNPLLTFIVETDDRSRVVLPGHSNTRYLVRENSDGSLLLQPARVVTEAQYEYDTDPALQELLARSAAAPTVTRPRRERRAPVQAG